MNTPNVRRFVLITMVLVTFATACGGESSPTFSLSGFTPAAEAAETTLHLTVYNQGTALVKDFRQFDIDEGLNVISFSDVAATIDPTSVLFKNLTNPEGMIDLEQNYEYDLVGVASLLEKYLDETINVVSDDGTRYTGTLISGRSDIILQDKNGEVTVIRLDHVQEFSFPELPDGLIVKPTMVWQLLAEDAGV